MKKITTYGLVLLSLTFGLPEVAKADVAGLTPCGKSSQFKARQKKAVGKLQSRLKKYEKGTPPALSLEKQIEKTNIRFDKYAKSNLLCGTDGLPHLIVDGDLNHAGEFVIPGVMFLYITGWIGWVGRKYLLFTKTTSKPAEKEIIIDVPMALKISSSGFLWPIAAWKEFTSGNLIVNDNQITVSPR